MVNSLAFRTCSAHSPLSKRTSDAEPNFPRRWRLPLQQSVLKLSKPLLFTAVAVWLATGQAMAQSAGNAYRAEIVLLERIVAPEDVEEQMANRRVQPQPELPSQLVVTDANGNSHSTLRLVPKHEMTLSRAADRLVNSGRYKVLMTAGWYQSFPPNYNGQPMQVAVGDWLPEAGMREVEGTITIDRQRFLHVGVELNHWQPMPQTSQPQQTELQTGQPESVAAMASGGELQGAGSIEIMDEPQLNAELLTWIRETRRMRSEEIHFLDSPTIGVLVLFKKIGG
nr:CsiV family protein [Marinobacter zhejiangensis]